MTCEKKNQSLIFRDDRKMPTLGSTAPDGNSASLIPHWSIGHPGWNFSVPIDPLMSWGSLRGPNAHMLLKICKSGIFRFYVFLDTIIKLAKKDNLWNFIHISVYNVLEIVIENATILDYWVIYRTGKWKYKSKVLHLELCFRQCKYISICSLVYALFSFQIDYYCSGWT